MPRTIVITGTSSGFGKLCVERFAAEGWNVVATVRKESDLAVHGDLSGVHTMLLNVDDEQADLALADLAVAQSAASTPWSTTPATTKPVRWKPRPWTRSTASSRPTSSASSL